MPHLYPHKRHGWQTTYRMLLSYAGQETFTIYTKDWQVDGYAVRKDGQEAIELYNKDWSRKGFIKKEGDNYTIYNERWERKGYIRKEDYGRDDIKK